MLRVIRAAEAKKEEALEEEAQDTSPDAVGEANLANRKPPRVRAAVPVLPLLEIFAPLTPLVSPGSPHGRLGAAAPLRESHVFGGRLALRTLFLRFRSDQFPYEFYTIADLHGQLL